MSLLGRMLLAFLFMCVNPTYLLGLIREMWPFTPAHTLTSCNTVSFFNEVILFALLPYTASSKVPEC